MWAKSGGIPGDLCELVAGSIEAESLRLAGEVWRLTGSIVPSIGLARRYEARLAALPDDQRRAVELVALAESIPFELATRLIAREVLAMLERSGWLHLPDDLGPARCELAHPAARMIVDRSVGPMSRQEHYRTLAAGTADAEDPDEMGRVLRSMWVVRSGGGAAIPEIEPCDLARTARLAFDLGRIEIGSELAVASNAREPGAAAALTASWCLAELGDHRGAIELLERTRPLIDDEWDRAALALRQAEEAWWSGGCRTSAIQLLRSERGGLGPAASLLDAQLAMFDMFDGRLFEASAVAEYLVAHEHPWVRFVAAIVATVTRSHFDDPDGALSIARNAFDETAAYAGEVLGDRHIHLLNQIEPLVHAARIGEAVVLAEMCEEVARSLGAIPPRGWSALHLGNTLLHAGRVADAANAFLQAEALWNDAGITGLARWSAAGAAMALGSVGDVDGANSALDRLMAADSGGFALRSPTALHAAGWVAGVAGDLLVAQASLFEAVELELGFGSTMHVAGIGLDAARLGLYDVCDRVEDAVARCTPGPLSRAKLGAMRALRSADVDLLARCADEAEDCGLGLVAAELAAVGASVASASSRPRDAERLAARSQGLLAGLGRVGTPLSSGRRGRALLTARETAVARLAADGVTSREIAEQLFISQRTVESHLYRSYNKLGITNRAELAVALDRTT